MIKIINVPEKTNSYYPEPWGFSTDPFPAYRGSGARYHSFLGFARGFDSQKPSKLIKTQKGLLLVSCKAEEDERIALITLLSGFRGYYSRIETENVEVIEKRSCDLHCVESVHIIAKFLNCGTIIAETGRRCGTGIVEIIRYTDPEYLRMTPEEADVWLTQVR